MLSLFKKFESQSRINRYIMECKSGLGAAGGISAVAELIDTLWNVNTVAGLTNRRYPMN